MKNTSANAYQCMELGTYSKEILAKIERKAEERMKEKARKDAVKSISFFGMAKNFLGFRECAKLIEIGRNTGCEIRLTANEKTGMTDSILSLLNLQITKDTFVVISVRGNDTREAILCSMSVLGIAQNH